jgi:Holliday junction resolvasome RuvABC endonuclease subunit
MSGLRIAGIDLGGPGGWAILVPGGQLASVLAWGKLDKGLRLSALREIVVRTIRVYDVGLVATERPFTGRWDPRPRVGMSQKQKQAIVIEVCQEKRVQFEDYPPWEIKKAATGSGRATKEQMMRAARFLLQFDPKDEHAADAALTALVGLMRQPRSLRSQ